MKQFPLFAILAISLALFLSCGQHSDDPELKTQIYIQGTVKDASSSLPIADAEITLSFGGSTLHQGKTDGEGAFSFPISEAGDYKFLVSASGYDDTEKLFPLTDLSKNNVTITMERSTFLTIKNESSFALEKVTWNGVDFGTMAVNAAPVKKSVKPYSSQITFSVPGKGLNAKINAFLEIKQGEDVAYSIRDDILVTEINEAIAGIFDNTTTLKLVEKAEAPKTGNLNVTDISYTSAKLNSSIAKSGNPQFTEKGFCYSPTNALPEKAGSTCVAVDGNTTNFELSVGDLQNQTRYYVRAYIENANGIFYSKDAQSFGINLLIDPRDGKTYKTKIFGGVTWMIEDLRNSSTGSYYWGVAIDICPSGWHLPSNNEWSNLSELLGTDAGTYFTNNSYWWSATEDATSYVYVFKLSTSTNSLIRNNSYKGSLYSVRCVMD